MKRTPVFVTLYGPPKTGKSLDLAKTVGGGIILTPAPGNMDAAWGAAGFRAQEKFTPTVLAARDAIRALPKRSDGRGIIGIDDATVMAQRSRAAAEKVASDALDVFKRAANELSDLREAAMESGYTVVSVFHPLEPGEEFKKRGSQEAPKKYVGGPAVASKKMMPVWAGVSWMLLRAVSDTSSAPLIWPVRYRCDPMELSQWLTGDRSAACGVSNPPNLREILIRAAESGQYNAVPARPQGLEWIDDMAEWVAGLAARGASTLDCARALSESARGCDPRHLRWALQDGFARNELRSMQSSWTQYFQSLQVSPAATQASTQPGNAGPPVANQPNGTGQR